MKPEIKTSTWPNGQKSLEIPYVNGQRHGFATYWNENGQKRYEIPYVNGQQYGLATGWHTNGQKRYEIPYINGQRHGLITEWFSDGLLRYVEKMHQNQMVWRILFPSQEQILENAEVELFFHEIPYLI